VHQVRGKPSLALALLLWVAAAPLPCFAAEVWSDEEGERSLSLDTTLKTSGLGSYGPYDPVLFPDRWSAAALFRLRLGLGFTYSELINGELAYEHRARLATDAGGGRGGGALPSGAGAPYRLTQLDAELARSGDTFSYRHELDRAFVSLHPPWGEVTVGRQAIGLGRGVVFGAVDVFAPFSTLEVDREWRRGVDAARIELRLSDTISAELLAAFGETWDDSALLGRIRGYVGNVDGEVIFGKRAEDTLCGVTLSAPVADAEVHIELAVFDTPEDQPDGGLFGNDRLVGKAVLGGSYTFDVRNGLTVLGEYHYSGFGVKDLDDAVARFADPAFTERFLRGDMQILGRHAAALQLSYPVNDAWNASFLVLVSPADGSGVVSPSVTYDLAQNVTIIASGFVPWGAGPSGGRFQSEYGANPFSLFLQLSLYF